MPECPYPISKVVTEGSIDQSIHKQAWLEYPGDHQDCDNKQGKEFEYVVHPVSHYLNYLYSCKVLILVGNCASISWFQCTLRNTQYETLDHSRYSSKSN